MSLEFDGLDKLRNLLGDTTLKETEIEGGPELKRDFTFEAGDLNLGLKPNASFVITKFDEEKDKDPDNVLGVPKEVDPPSSALKPQISWVLPDLGGRRDPGNRFQARAEPVLHVWRGCHHFRRFPSAVNLQFEPKPSTSAAQATEYQNLRTTRRFQFGGNTT